MGLFLGVVFVVRMFFKKLWNWMSPKHEGVFYIDLLLVSPQRYTLVNKA